MLTTLAEPEPIMCRGCGSDQVVLAFGAPVYALIKRGAVARVVVSDEEVEFRNEAWCRRCGNRWRLQAEPEVGTWPAWEVGW